jgi:hypothetical protein
MQWRVEQMKHLKTPTYADLDALLSAILQSSLGFRLRTASPRQVAATGDRAFIHLHGISAFIRFHLISARLVEFRRDKSARREGEL